MVNEFKLFNNSDFGNSELIDSIVSLLRKKLRDNNIDAKFVLNKALNGALIIGKDKNKVPVALLYDLIYPNDNRLDNIFRKEFEQLANEKSIGKKILKFINRGAMAELTDFIFNTNSDKKYLSNLLDASIKEIALDIVYLGKDKYIIKELLNKDFIEIKSGSKKYYLKIKD